MSFQTRNFHFFHISGYVFKDEIQVTGLEFTWKKLKKKLSLKFGKINGTGRWNLSIVCVVIFFFFVTYLVEILFARAISLPFLFCRWIPVLFKQGALWNWWNTVRRLLAGPVTNRTQGQRARGELHLHQGLLPQPEGGGMVRVWQWKSGWHYMQEWLRKTVKAKDYGCTSSNPTSGANCSV